MCLYTKISVYIIDLFYIPGNNRDRDLQLPVQPVSITTNVVSSNLVHGEV